MKKEGLLGFGETGQGIGKDIVMSGHAVGEDPEMLLELKCGDEPANLESDWVSGFAVE